MSKSTEAMRQANLIKYQNMTAEEKKERTRKAHEANRGSKRTEEAKKKMSESRKKFMEENPDFITKHYKKVSETQLNKTPEEKEAIRLKKSETMKKRWAEIRQDKEKMEARSAKLSKRMKEDNPLKNPEVAERLSKKMTGRKLPDEHKRAIAENASGTPKSRWYEVAGLICQGRSEKMFIESLVNSGSALPERGMAVQTPFGFYKPDFNFRQAFYVEIKSSYTYEQMLEKEQLKKIQWVNENIKPVKIFIVDSIDDVREVPVP